MRCKQKCAEKLGNLNGEIHKDLFASHYNYLQFAYYKSNTPAFLIIDGKLLIDFSDISTVNNMEKACQAVASYQLFFPDDETMNDNKAFYLTLDGVTLAMFQARNEALTYFERNIGEKALLKFIEVNFQFDEGDIHEAAQVTDNEILEL